MRRVKSKAYLDYSKNFPSLNTFWIPSNLGKHGIPVLQKVDLKPDELCPYDERRKSDEYDKDLPKNVAIHFFMTDHWFNGIWTYPERAFQSICRFDCVISPDFSLYRDWPLSMQMWNTYRNRWLGAWWTQQGMKVIPSVNWSTKESYDFCFEGLPTKGTLAITTMEINSKDKLGRQLFLAGFEEMLRRCELDLLLVYGKGFPRILEEKVSVQRYAHRLTEVHQRLS